jgi:hypothetical protein
MLIGFLKKLRGLHLSVGQQFGTHANALLVVHLQKPRRSGADIRPSDDEGSPELEMVLPHINPWMEQADHFFRLGVDGRKIWALVTIAIRASQREVVGGIIGHMLLGLNMFNVEREKWSCRLGQTAIFASIPGPRTHELPSGSIHNQGRMRRRALDCIRVTKWNAARYWSYSTRSVSWSVP